MRALLLIFLLLLATPASAQPKLLQAHSAASSFTGPIDAAGVTPSAAYCLRACSAAKAAALANIVNIRNGVSGSTTDITSLSTGALDTATAITFLGTDATGTGSITGTALTFTGGHQFDTVTGTGVTAGTYIVSGASPNWVVNLSQTVASTTLSLQPMAFIATWYDQSGSGFDCTHSSPNQLKLMLFGGGTTGTVPYILSDGGSGNCAAAGGPSVSQPFTINWVAIRTGAFTAIGSIVSTATSSTADRFSATANNFQMRGGSAPNVAATDSVWHTEQSFYNGASSVPYTDGTAGAANSPGAGALSGIITIGASLTGNVEEILLLPTLNSTQRQNLCINQTGTYPAGYGRATTCN